MLQELRSHTQTKKKKKKNHLKLYRSYQGTGVIRE